MGMSQGPDLPGLFVLSKREIALPTDCHLAMSRRDGGVSPHPYDSLNLSYAVQDDPARVAANRKILAAALGLEPAGMTFAAQAHGLRLQVVGAAERGRGNASLEDAFPETDALLTEEPDTPLVILTADCYPVAVMAPGCVAVAHAGWRGTLGNLPGLCVEALKDRGYSPDEMVACLGPGIRECCYLVDEGRRKAFVERYGEDEEMIRESSRGVRLNLEKANIRNLLEAGLRPERIYSQGDCTACDPGYFSFRRDGLTGRQSMVVWMSEEMP